MSYRHLTETALARDTYCIEDGTGCQGILPAGTPIMFLEYTFDGWSYFYTRTLNGWTLEYAYVDVRAKGGQGS